MPGKLDYQLHYRRNLPHIQPEGTPLFITMRLHDSLPAAAIQRLKQERQQLRREIERSTAPDANKRARLVEADRRQFNHYDTLLDKAEHGPTWLSHQPVAEMVCTAILHFDARRYDLEAYCVMPNHAHLVLTPRPKSGEDHSLSGIMHSLKGYTAVKANRILGRNGAFWQHESYDHYVRSPAELGRIVGYVLYNPVKAGLITEQDAWPWSYWKYAGD